MKIQMLAIPIILFLLGTILGGWVSFIGLVIGILYALGMLYFRNRYDLVTPITGGTMDAVAIVSNNWKMPVLHAPWQSLDAAHSAMTISTHLKFLCDIFSIGHLYTFSLGDVLIFIGWPLTILGIYAYNKYRKAKTCE